MGFFDVLLIIFVVLKLTSLISWAWSVVLIPLWITLVCFVFVLALKY